MTPPLEKAGLDVNEFKNYFDCLVNAIDVTITMSQTDTHTQTRTRAHTHPLSQSACIKMWIEN